MTGKTPSVPQINHVDKSPVGGSFTLPRVIAIVAPHAKGTHPANIGPDTRLDELGIDDLTQVEIWESVEGEFGFRADDMHWAEVETVGEIVALIDKLHGGR